MTGPRRGEVWFGDLGVQRPYEQAGLRPVVIVSSDDFNSRPLGLVVVVPLTTRERDLPYRVPVDPPEGGLARRSFVLCEAIRSVSHARLERLVGSLHSDTMAEVDRHLGCILDLTTPLTDPSSQS